jgi:hypothetical protein
MLSGLKANRDKHASFMREMAQMQRETAKETA